MGTACCGEDRKIASSKNSAKPSKENVKLHRSIDASSSKRYNNEDDPSYLTDVYLTTKETFTSSAATTVLKQALSQAKATTSDKAIPFLVTALDLSSSKIAVFSRNCEDLAVDPDKIERLVESHVVKSCNLPIKATHLQDFFKQTQGLTLFGCVNDVKEGKCDFYLYPNDKAIPVEHKLIEPQSKDKIEEIFTEWARKDGVYFKLCYPVCDPESSRILHYVLVGEKLASKTDISYTLTKISGIENLEADLTRREMTGAKFVGVLAGVDAIYLIFHN